MENFLVTVLTNTILDKYCKNEQTIEELVKQYKQVELEIREGKDFEEKLKEITSSINILNNILFCEKFKDNKKDMQHIINLFKDEIKNLEELIEE